MSMYGYIEINKELVEDVYRSLSKDPEFKNYSDDTKELSLTEKIRAWINPRKDELTLEDGFCSFQDRFKMLPYIQNIVYTLSISKSNSILMKAELASVICDIYEYYNPSDSKQTA